MSSSELIGSVGNLCQSAFVKQPAVDRHLAMMYQMLCVLRKSAQSTVVGICCSQPWRQRSVKHRTDICNHVASVDRSPVMDSGGLTIVPFVPWFGAPAEGGLPTSLHIWREARWLHCYDIFIIFSKWNEVCEEALLAVNLLYKKNNRVLHYTD